MFSGTFRLHSFNLQFPLMTSQNNLEIKGNLSVNPLAELLTEISQVGFDGSLRLANEARKVIVYFNEGKVVFAVSNLKQHRLAKLILSKSNLDKQNLAQNLTGANDLEIAKNLTEKGILSKAEIDALFTRQISEILQTVLNWQEGEWIFSPFARIKETVQQKVEVHNLLMEYARELPKENVIKHFISLTESFGVRPSMPAHVNLLPKESFVLSRFENSFIKVEEVKVLSGLSDAETLQILYSLWLGGFLYRQNWKAAFNDRKISDILSAKLSLRKEEEDLPIPEPQNATPTETVKPEKEKAKPVEPIFSLEDYLNQTEKATNHYETLGVALQAATADIKKAYFAFAKQFHPDFYHRNTEPELHHRIQNAFTKVAQAYDVLRVESTREVYDFKLRKELANSENLKSDKSSTETVDPSTQAKYASESFEHGFTLLMEERYDESVPYLGRAVHLAGDNARYHAFYGKALSFDEKQRYKAEAEIQLAIKLDPNNSIHRIILAEFFIHYGLPKRAEGELKRLLAIEPGNQEALALLDRLRQK